MKKLIAAALIAGTALIGFPAAAGADASIDISDLLPRGGACGEGRIGVVITVDNNTVAACVDPNTVPLPQYGPCAYPDKGVVIYYLGHTVSACVDTGWLTDAIAFDITT